jgi:hypothetical protein
MVPAPSSCAIKNWLSDELKRANSLLIELDNQDVQAVLAGEWGRRSEITAKIETARILRREAVQAYRDHIIEHGC